MFATDTKRLWRVTLRSDQDRPEDQRPAFLVRTLSARQFRELDEQLAGIDSAKTGRGGLDIAVAGIQKHLVGWEHIPDTETHVAPGGEWPMLGFDPSRLEDILTADEIYELAWSILRGARLTSAEKKDSPSPLPSASGSSAPTAAATPAAAAGPYQG
jgi:hypothetical protein